MKRPAFIVAIAIFLITHAANLQIPLYRLDYSKRKILSVKAKKPTGKGL